MQKIANQIAPERALAPLDDVFFEAKEGMCVFLWAIVCVYDRPGAK